MTVVGAPPNSQPASAALRTLRIRRMAAGKSDDEKQDVIPGNAIERRAPGSRKDQERERQHQRDQQIEIFGVELGVADEEAQRELLVDAQQDGRRGRNHQRPAPRPAQCPHARDFGFLHVAACGSSNSIRFAGATTLSLAEGDIISLETVLRLRLERIEAVLLFKAVRHVGFCQRRSARLHPAVEKRLVIRWRVGLAVVRPCRGQYLPGA